MTDTSALHSDVPAAPRQDGTPARDTPADNAQDNSSALDSESAQADGSFQDDGLTIGAFSAKEAAEDAGIDTDEMISSAKAGVADASQNFLDEIQAQPLRALAAAAAIGFVAGWIASR